MSLDIRSILDAMASHAMASGLFDTVNRHEPKSKPGNGITAAIWPQTIRPTPRGSGLISTTSRIELTVRLYSPMLSEPQDDIDPALVGACDLLMAAYSGDFTLGGIIKEIDLLGEYGEPLSARAGYLNIDGKIFRIYDVTVPVIVNDLWTQGE